MAGAMSEQRMTLSVTHTPGEVVVTMSAVEGTASATTRLTPIAALQVAQLLMEHAGGAA